MKSIRRTNPQQHHKQTDLPTIDLHSLNREQALRRTTDFLETHRRNHHDAWVMVITGSGQHSPQGPVLREAVRSLLERQEMEYTLNRGKASFTVNASSGFLQTSPPPPTCSKIKVVPSLPQRGDSLIKLKQRAFHGELALDRSQRRPERRRQERPVAAPQAPEPDKVAPPSQEEFPLRPHEVANEDKDFERAHRASLEDHRLVQKAHTAERKDLDKALEKSAESKFMEQTELVEQARALQEALGASFRALDEDERNLEKALSLSALSLQREPEEGKSEDELLQEALSKSLNDLQWDGGGEHKEDEDDDFRRVLETSKQESHRLPKEEEEDFRRALEASKQESHRKRSSLSRAEIQEAEELLQVLRLSRRWN